VELAGADAPGGFAFEGVSRGSLPGPLQLVRSTSVRVSASIGMFCRLDPAQKGVALRLRVALSIQIVKKALSRAVSCFHLMYKPTAASPTGRR
jgi:hypothetical protein